MLRSRVCIQTTMTLANAGVTVSDYGSAAIDLVRFYYPNLRPGGAAWNWQNGAPFRIITPVHELSVPTGISAWSITAEPGLVPGRLDFAVWNAGTPLANPPDSVTSYNLGPGAWDTGALPVYTHDLSLGQPAPIDQGMVRFIPIPLVSLLPP